jgi:hypothetical protein
MSNGRKEPAEPTPWDQVGGFLQDMSDVGQRIAKRNIELWNTVSRNLEKQKYTADDMANDSAKIVSASMRNLQASWGLMTRVPERQTVAALIPTALLVFEGPDGSGQPMTPDAVWVRVPFLEDDEKLPEEATIDLGGSDQGTVDTLRTGLTATLGDSGQSYLLSYSYSKPLAAGAYTGVVYIEQPSVRAVANLRIVVK